MTRPDDGRFVLEALRESPVADRRVELVERKGLGHPDTICDLLVETISRELTRMYRARAGTILHNNVDKALLVAGQSAKGFGGGRVLQPMELVVGDRATFEVNGTRLPVEETVRAAVDDWLRARLPHLRPETDFRLRVALAPGTVTLQSVLPRGDREVRANDTSGASGYAPLSPTEALVLAAEQYLNGPDFKSAFPDTGQDVKVFAWRRDARVSLTVAMPLLCAATPSEASYFQRKAAILAALADRFRGAPLETSWALNTLDTPGQGADGVYLTLTGTSAEDADSGQVGRGNRANGLIAFSRPSGGEAAAGKNPVAHPGKLYSVLSHLLARRIHARHPALREVYVHLAVRIGEPVDRPWTGVQVVLADGMELRDLAPAIEAIVEAELQRIPQLREELILGRHPVC